MENDFELKMILFYLKENGSITAREAYQLCGCKKLQTRMRELKKMGIPIKSVTRTFKNRAGNKVRYTTYILEA